MTPGKQKMELGAFYTCDWDRDLRGPGYEPGNGPKSALLYLRDGSLEGTLSKNE